MVIAFGWSVATSEPALAQPQRLDIAAGPLGRSIAELARQSGVSIGTAIGLPAQRARALRGRMPVAQALAFLLRGTGLRAVPLGADLWRIDTTPTAVVRRLRNVEDRGVGEPFEHADILVTGTKHRELLASTAAPVTIVSPEMLSMLGNTPGTREIAAAINGLSATNLGPGRNRLFIRGVADSPFDGFGQSSVSVQVDEARLTYDAPDPDLRLVDMAQIEVLKGPQGPLYGTGALGGVYRLVTAKPDLGQASAMIEGGVSITRGGTAAGAFDGVVNLPIVGDRLAVRLVGYRIGQGGWLASGDGARSINHGQTSGGRIAVRAQAGDDWIIDLEAVGQEASVANSQYVDTAETLTRAARISEPQDTGAALISATANGSIGAAKMTAVASLASQEVNATYDASAKAVLLGGSAPAAYRDSRQYRVGTAEVRATLSSGPVDELIGASYLSAATDATGTLIGTTTIPVLKFRRRVEEVALFGEATWLLSPTWRVITGIRVFQSSVDDDRTEGLNKSAVGRTVVRASPSATVAWQPHARLLVFARYASALRPGGIDTTSGTEASSTTYQADELQAYDLGARWTSPTDRVSVDLDLFASAWAHVQADYLGADGLISTRNAGDASNRGVDLSLGWRPSAKWSLSAGSLLQHARINPGALPGIEPDRRLPIVPDISAHGEAVYTLDAGDWQIRTVARITYAGETRLSFDPGLDRESGPVAILSASFAAGRGTWQWRAAVDNLLDTDADSFAFGNPFSASVSTQRTPVRPRTLTLSVHRAF